MPVFSMYALFLGRATFHRLQLGVREAGNRWLTGQVGFAFNLSLNVY
jgi:hypothetical protein